MGDLRNATQHATQKAAQKRLIFYGTIFNATFFEKYLVVRYKPYNFAGRYKERKETTETEAAKCIHAHGHNRNKMRVNSLFDKLFNC